MFFVLSKVVWGLIQPISVVALLLAVALVAMFASWGRLAFAATLLALLILVVAAFTSVGALMLQPLEDRFARPDPAPAAVDGIVVLGGGLEGGINLARGGYEMNSAGDRFVETAILARRYPDARILVSGGTGTLILDGEGDGTTAPRLLTALGIDRSRLILDNESRNTAENAAFSKRLAAPETGETWLLVTSAFHMPRSVALFDAVGFETVPWPVDYRTRGDEGVELFADNPGDALQAFTIGMREWIGLIAYRLSGRTDRLLPTRR